MIKIRIAASVICLLLFTSLYGQVTINEFMAQNISSRPDMVDFDDFSDWIELYNGSANPVDLSGYYLTDNLGNPLKWAIPYGTIINADDYLLIWADGNSADIGESFPRGYWPWEDFSTKSLHTNFKLSSSGEELGLFKSDKIAENKIISKGDSWKYLDDGSDQQTDWRMPNFNDNNWNSGNAKFGYGDNNEVTTLNYGGSSSNKFITYYFRKEFNITESAVYDSALVHLLRDDGAVIYINGNEVVRSNMPTGEINYKTKSASGVGGSEETAYFTYNIPVSLLSSGNNLIAVEVHQTGSTSSDLGFDLEMLLFPKVINDSVVLVDSITFGQQKPDVSYGRLLNNNSKWGYYFQSTPGSENNSPTITNLTYSEDVTFSLQSGFYSTPQTLTLSSNGTPIYYTIDGSIPTAKSLLYNEPIQIPENRVIRARTISSDKLPGSIITKSYFISESNFTLPVVSLVSEPKYLWDDEIGIYKNNYKHKEIPSVVEYFNKNGDFEFNVNAGTRIGGYNIWRFEDKPLNIFLRNKYGSDAINYKLFENKPIGLFTAIRLRNGGDSWEKTLLNDAMSESLLNGQMENGIQAYSPCILFINGEYRGVHNIREKNDTQYFVSNFNADPNNVTHLEYNFLPPYGSFGMQAILGDMSSYKKMLSFAESANLAQQENYNYLAAQMDMDNFINFIIAELYVCNTSWHHNREWWHSGIEGDKWKWLLPDIDRGFNYSNINKNLIGDFKNDFSLFNALLKNKTFNDKFVQTFAAHLNSTFSAKRINGIVDSLANIIAPEMERHIAKWKNYGGISSLESWRSQLEVIKNFANDRSDIVFGHLNSSFNLNGTSSLVILPNIPKAATIKINNVPISEISSPLKFFKNVPLTVSAIPNAGYKFTGWQNLSDSAEISITLNDDLTLIPIFEKDTLYLLNSNISSTVQLKSGTTYYTTGDVIVDKNGALQIDDGVEIRMAENSSIYVYGELNIEGTVENSVRIIPNIQSGAKAWGAICFENSSKTGKINYAYISGATNGKDPINQIGAISSNSSELVINGVTMENVNYPIFVNNGKAGLYNSSIKTDVTCDFIHIINGEGVVENNLFYGNYAPNTDGVDFDGVKSGIIRNNKFYNFEGFNCDAIDIGEKSESILIEGNLIYNSNDKGISVGQTSSVVVIGNVIISCGMGIAVKDNSTAEILNNTFFQNDYSVACFEKNSGNGGGTATVVNSILSASKIDAVLEDKHSSVQISYSLSDTQPLNGTNNLFVNPKFVDPFNYDVSLDESSPAIDAGDPNGDKDLDGSLPDIGANYKYSMSDYPSTVRSDISNRIVINEIMYNDGIAGGGDWVELYNTSEIDIDISGWNLSDEDTTHKFIFSEGTVINKKSYLIICHDSTSFSTAYPSVTDFISEEKFGLDGNDRVLLIDDDGNVINNADYNNSAPWPENSDGTGNSIEFMNPNLVNSSPFSWKSSTIENGTPGKLNSTYVPTSIKTRDKETLLNDFVLYQNYPNPFNPTTQIDYSVPINLQNSTNIKSVQLIVYDVLGRKISTLVNEPQSAGRYSVQFDAKQLSSGMYIYQLKIGEKILSKKMMLLK